MPRRVLLGLLTLVLSALPLAASTFLYTSPEELVAEADAVVRGEVLETHSFWDDKAILIYTEALVRVDELLVGEAPGLLTIRTAGGTVGSYTVEAHGFPEFRQGERLIAFLKFGPDGISRIVGYRQGQFRVMGTPAGRVLAVPTVEGRYLRRDGRPAPAPRAVSLDEFRGQIREVGRKLGRMPER